MSPIEKISIPDEDVPGWIQTLREGHFTDEEIDAILRHLNETYADLQDKVAAKEREDWINQELVNMEAPIKQKRGFGFTDEERAEIRKGIESRFPRS